MTEEKLKPKQIDLESKQKESQAQEIPIDQIQLNENRNRILCITDHQDNQDQITAVQQHMIKILRVIKLK